MKTLGLFQNVAPSDSVDVAGARWEYLVVPSGGAVRFTTYTDEQTASAKTVTFPPGIWPVAVKRIFATGTTAANLSVAL